MLKLFNNYIDKQFKKLGFSKIRENEYGVIYKRYNKKFDYYHRIDIIFKSNGKHIVQSFDPELFDTKKIGNTCVGLTARELKLCYWKLSALKRIYKR